MSIIVGNTNDKYIYAPNIREYNRLKREHGQEYADKKWNALKGKKFLNQQYRDVAQFRTPQSEYLTQAVPE